MARSETSAKAPEALDCRVVLARESHWHYWAENHPFWYFPPNCNQFASVFSHLVFAPLVSNCVCTRGLFLFMCSFGDHLDRPVWRKPYFGWCINNQGLFKVSHLLKTGIPSLDKSNPRKGLIFRDISYLRCIRIDTTVEQSFQKPFLIIHRQFWFSNNLIIFFFRNVWPRGWILPGCFRTSRERSVSRSTGKQDLHFQA